MLPLQTWLTEKKNVTLFTSFGFHQNVIVFQQFVKSACFLPFIKFFSLNNQLTFFSTTTSAVSCRGHATYRPPLQFHYLHFKSVSFLCCFRLPMKQFLFYPPCHCTGLFQHFHLCHVLFSFFYFSRPWPEILCKTFTYFLSYSVQSTVCIEIRTLLVHIHNTIFFVSQVDECSSQYLSYLVQFGCSHFFNTYAGSY